MLKGKKVVLRAIDIEKDLERCTSWFNDPEVLRFLGKPYRPMTKEQEREALQKIISQEDNFFFAIDTLDGVHIGTTGFNRVYHFDRTAIAGMVIGDKLAWNKGYGTDALMLLLHFGFTVHNLRRINSAAIAFNKRSIKCQQKCGFKIEGVKKREVYKDGDYHDLVMLAVFRDDWLRLWREYQGMEVLLGITREELESFSEPNVGGGFITYDKFLKRPDMQSQRKQVKTKGNTCSKCNGFMEGFRRPTSRSTMENGKRCRSCGYEMITSDY